MYWCTDWDGFMFTLVQGQEISKERLWIPGGPDDYETLN